VTSPLGRTARPSEELTDIELCIEKIVPGGEGFARLPDGQPVFVRAAAPGDRIRLRSLQKQRGRWVTEDYQLVLPSAERTSPECPVAATCGGCDLMHLRRDSELRQKASMLREALERGAGVSPDAPAAVEEVGPVLGYRARVRFHVGKHGKLGFFARASHQLVEVPSCAVAHPDIVRALGMIRRLARRFPEALPGFSDVELRATTSGVLARFFPRDGIKPIRAEPFLRALGKELSVAATEREAQAISERRELPGGVYVDVPADAFSQINPSVNEVLVSAVVEGAGSRQLKTFCDLFAGVGNFALPLAKLGLSGVMVERSPSAVRAAQKAAAAQGIVGLRARTEDASRAVRDLVREGQSFELIVLDPPREGAADVMQGLAGLAPRAVAYVACDPVTLSRDLKILVTSGLRVISVRGFDMFPRTHHFETLVWLER